MTGQPSASSRTVETRRKILRTAAEMFAGVGFAGVTSAVLASRAGVAEGTIYRYFPGMRDLFQVCVQSAAHWLVALIEENGIEGQPADIRLRQLASRILDAAAKQPALVRLAVVPPSAHVFNDATRQSRQAVLESLQRVIATGKQEGKIRAGGANLWAPLWLHLLGHAAVQVASGEWDRDHPGIGLVLDSAGRLIAPEPPE